MAIDFLRLAVAFQQAAKNSHTSDPQKLLRHTSVGGTFPLTEAAVTSLATSLSIFTYAGTRVDGYGLLDNQTILDKFPDVLPCELKDQYKHFEILTLAYLS